MLYAYALANVHNVSWGTKGLITGHADPQAERLRMRRLRNATAGAILGIDAALILAGLSYSGRWITSVSCVVELFTFLCLVVVVNAAAVSLLSGCRSLRLPRLSALLGAGAARSAVSTAFAPAARAG